MILNVVSVCTSNLCKPKLRLQTVPNTVSHFVLLSSCDCSVSLYTSSLVFCRQSLADGRHGCWQPGCAPVWKAPILHHLVQGKSDAGRHWGYLEWKVAVSDASVNSRSIWCLDRQLRHEVVIPFFQIKQTLLFMPNFILRGVWKETKVTVPF